MKSFKYHVSFPKNTDMVGNMEAQSFETLADKWKHYQSKSGVSNYEIGKKINLDARRLSALDAGDIRIAYDDLKKYEQAIGIPAELRTSLERFEQEKNKLMFDRMPTEGKRELLNKVNAIQYTPELLNDLSSSKTFGQKLTKLIENAKLSTLEFCALTEADTRRVYCIKNDDGNARPKYDEWSKIEKVLHVPDEYHMTIEQYDRLLTITKCHGKEYLPGPELKQRRITLGLSVTEVAGLLNSHRTTIFGVERRTVFCKVNKITEAYMTLLDTLERQKGTSPKKDEVIATQNEEPLPEEKPAGAPKSLFNKVSEAQAKLGELFFEIRSFVPPAEKAPLEDRISYITKTMPALVPILDSFRDATPEEREKLRQSIRAQFDMQECGRIGSYLASLLVSEKSFNIWKDTEDDGEPLAEKRK